ncbi:MAG: translocation/assembly module TamB domain-containing protein [Terricaulis sp.]
MAEAKKRRHWHRLALAASAIAGAGGLALAVGPAAPWVVDHFGNGQRIGRVGTLHLEGVSGSWLGDLRVAHLEIADADGVWLSANDASAAWRPLDLLFGAVRLDRVHATALSIVRQPTLSTDHPSAGGTPDIHIGALRIDKIDIAEPVLGQAAQFNAHLALDYVHDALENLDVALQRTDSDADHLIASYRPDRAYAMHVDILGAPGGILARSLGVADQGLHFTAQGSGDARNGAAIFDAKIGAADLLAGETHWTPQNWRVEGHGQLSALPGLAELTKRIGPTASFTASGAHAGAFNAHVESTFATGDISGALTDKYELNGGAHFVVTTRRVSDIAPESPFELGAARVEGELRQARGVTAIRAQLVDGVVNAFGQTGHFSGPVQLSINADKLAINGELRAQANAAPLFANALAQTDLSFDFHRGRFALERARYASASFVGDGRGWVNHGDGEFSGAWRVLDLRAVSDLTGSGSGQWRAFAAPQSQRANPQRVWTVTAAGTGADISGDPNIVPQLTGRAPKLDGLFRAEANGIEVSHIRIDGDKLRAAATGHIRHGQADLSLEASARGPLSLGGASLDGALDATGHLSGPLARPTLTTHATLTSFTSGGVVVGHPVIDLTLAPGARGYAGHATAKGTVSGQPLTAAADVSIPGAVVAFSNLDAKAGGLDAHGSATIAPHGVTADLSLSGTLDGLAPDTAGKINGDLHLTPTAIALNAALADARFGDLRAHTASFIAQGPFNAIGAHYAIEGRINRAPLTLSGNATLDASHGDIDAHLQGEGELAGAAISTRTPMHFHFDEHGLDAAIDITMADGALVAEWTDQRRSLSGNVKITDAPLAPLAAIWGERATGRIDGTIGLANAGNGLSGSANFTLADARFVGRQRGTLNMHVTGTLEPNRLRALIDATSSDGLTARLEADAPVVTDNAPIRIALAPQREGAATWSIHGPASSLWAAARLQDQSLEGQLNGEGTLRFGAGSLTGDGHIEIADGRFEDKLSGIVLRNLNARISVSQNGVNIDNFTANDIDGGRMTVTGGSSGPQDGRLAVSLDNMRLANRPDLHAKGSGELALTWHGLHSNVTGAITLDSADVDIAANPDAGIPTIDVVEINQPYSEDDGGSAPILSVPTTTDLNVRIRAPGRIRTRGRGVDAEWSLDLRLSGSSKAPLLYGEARAVRGTLALSGQPFDIQDTSLIEFDGDPLDARVDITAIRETTDLTAAIHLSGTARNPEVALTSDPPLPDDEILPQVLFGHSVQDLSPLEAAQLAASLATLSGQSSLDLLGAARAAVGLDRFNVRQDENGGLLVSGGVYLSRGLYLEVARNGLGQAQTSVEWTVRRHLVLITSFLGNGDQRVSLRWRRESN